MALRQWTVAAGRLTRVGVVNDASLAAPASTPETSNMTDRPTDRPEPPPHRAMHPDVALAFSRVTMKVALKHGDFPLFVDARRQLIDKPPPA
jgi:hypothetical protein